MPINEDLFLQRYNKLNERQKEAVYAIYGPVMVIAGPGTGKTEVLSLRIANLLRSEAQVQPAEILCLTYTEEATNSMRRRLVQIIGTAAHRINICTFHAFCNNVIQSNGEYFSLRSLQPISDLERIELLDKIFRDLPQGHLLRKLSGNIFSDVNRLNSLFDLMKRENLSAAAISHAIDEYLNDLPAREDYIYKRATKEYKKGDLKQAQVDEETRRMNITRAAAGLFDTYKELMKQSGLYDFNDMIVWVLDAFKNNPALLQSYQERHQFILVDEFQDTNGSQSELLNLLSQYWEDPNIFVVGDDDQSIYEFQGARIRNIIDFYLRFKENIKIVVLPHNYRSSQLILDKAMATIQNNRQRLINELNDLQLDKNIIASSDRFKEEEHNVKPLVRVYNNILQEEADVVMHIEQLKNEGVNLGDIAIIYAQHKQATNLISLMERKGIPYNVKKPVNILDLPLIQQIIDVLRYLQLEQKEPLSGEAILFEMMHAPYYGIAPADIALLSLYIQANKAKDKRLGYWRLLLTNDLLLESLQLGSAKALRRLGNNIEQWQRHLSESPLPLLLEKIIYESGIVSHLLKTKDHIWNIQVLHTFFEYAKDLHSRNVRQRPAEFILMIERMEVEGISIPMQRVIQNDNGVHFYTAHGAKGNEFEYVFLVGCTKNFWEEKRGGGNEYKLPDTITRTNDDTEKTYKAEVARRLFYVALTRAKKFLNISYALNDNTGKPLQNSVFIDEICPPEERIMPQLSSDYLQKHMQWAMIPVPMVRIELANNQWIDRALQQIAISYTTLSKFLRCPLSFYYEQLLRVPFMKNDALAFGSAVHYALERFFKEMKLKHGEFPDKDHLIGAFRSAMFSESGSFTSLQFDRRMEQGLSVLPDYYEKYINTFSKNVEIEFKVSRFMLDGVPVTGKIDKIEFEGDSCKVVDYKTGDPDKSASALTAAPNEKDPLGGDYWRQMVFYKLLLENSEDRRWLVKMGMFDYIQKGEKSKEYKQVFVPVYTQDEEIVRKQIKDTYSRIMNHEFDTGCGKEDCHWCNFARQYQLIRPPKDEVVEIDDI